MNLKGSINFHPETENYKYWTAAEDKLMVEMINSGESYATISKILNRKIANCQIHGREYLGLKGSYGHSKKYTVDENFWSIPNKINSYYAGFSSADASLNKTKDSYTYRLCLAKLDINFLKDFKDIIKFTGPIHEHSRLNRLQKCGQQTISNVTEFQVHSRQWFDDLGKNFNIVQNKTKILLPPNIDISLIWCWLIGYLDGDGTIHFRELKKKKESHNPSYNLSIQFISSSKVIMDFICNLVHTYFKDNCLKSFNAKGWNFCKVRKRPNSNAYVMYVSGTRAAVLFDYLSQIQGLPRLNRKWLQPRTLEYVSNLKLKFPHLFKTFEYNDELNKQIQPPNPQPLPSIPETNNNINLTNPSNLL